MSKQLLTLYHGTCVFLSCRSHCLIEHRVSLLLLIDNYLNGPCMSVFLCGFATH